MRKKVIKLDTLNPQPHSQEKWLNLEEIARIEVTSEDPSFPIEAALTAREPRSSLCDGPLRWVGHS
jgi:hypothetical protein